MEIIQIDTREKARAISPILKAFDEHGIKHFGSKLYVGDYMNFDNPRLIIDRKLGLLEICTNVIQDHKRFTREIKRANDAGIKMIFLIGLIKRKKYCGVDNYDDTWIKSLDDLRKWENPRIKSSPLAVSGDRLFKILFTIENTYGVKFVFCPERELGNKIIELLEV